MLGIRPNAKQILEFHLHFEHHALSLAEAPLTWKKIMKTYRLSENVWKMPEPPRPVCDHAQNRGLFASVEQRFGEIMELLPHHQRVPRT